MTDAGLHGLVMFRLCGKVFGLPVESVREVVPIAQLDQPAHMPSLAHGVLNLGGSAVLVLRLDRLLGLGSGGGHGIHASILVMRGEAGGGVLGLLVDHVDGVAQASDCTRMDFSDRHSFNGCVVERFERGGIGFDLLSWPKLLLIEEKLRLAEFNMLAQARLAQLAVGKP